jgi:hypothetical protein
MVEDERSHAREGGYDELAGMSSYVSTLKSKPYYDRLVHRDKSFSMLIFLNETTACAYFTRGLPMGLRIYTSYTTTKYIM